MNSVKLTIKYFLWPQKFPLIVAYTLENTKEGSRVIKIFKQRLSVNKRPNNLLKDRTITQSKTAVNNPISRAVVTMEDSFFTSFVCSVFDVILLTTKGSPLDINVSKTIKTENET